MSKQKLNPEELKNVLKNLNQCETTVVDNLIKIKDKYLSLDDSEIWLGPKSESFHESIRNYWNFSPKFLNTFVGPLPKEDTLANGNGAIIDNIQSDFKTLVNFINIAISKVTKTDEDVSKNIEGSTSNQTGNKTNNEKKEDVSELGTKAPSTTTPQTTKPAEPTTKPEESTTKKKPAMAPPKTDFQEDSSTGGAIPNASSSNGTQRNVSVGGFYPQESNNENTYVAGLNYKIVNADGTPARSNIAKENIKINDKDYQVYTYDDPETPEREHYIIGALLEDGERSKQTGKVYTIDYGNGDVYEFVDLDTNYTKKKGSEKTPSAAMDTYVDILSVKGHAYNNVGIESREPVKIADTGKTVSRK